MVGLPWQSYSLDVSCLVNWGACMWSFGACIKERAWYFCCLGLAGGGGGVCVSLLSMLGATLFTVLSPSPGIALFHVGKLNGPPSLNEG